jgi:3D (Asp-Asp-Asp) domain-containing protein
MKNYNPILIWLIIINIIVTGATMYNVTTQEVEAQQIEVRTEYITKEVIKNEYQVFEVTAYTAGFESTGKTKDDPLYKVTASGQLAWENITLACPPSMKFGTKIYFKGIDNVYTCTDRGSAITEGHLDIYMEDLERALYFGRQQMEVLVIP